MTDTSPVERPVSPRRNTPTPKRSKSSLRERNNPSARTPLRDKSNTASRENIRREKRELTDVDIFSTTPFPTKPQQILLPSTIRKQRSFHEGEAQFAGFHAGSDQDVGLRQLPPGRSGLTARRDRPRRAPVVQLKRSVTTLRDMYEAQEKSSRPSTAASPALRPTSSSSRLRSVSSSEGLAGRYAWERLQKTSADDMALLPTLSQPAIQDRASHSSFVSRTTRMQPLTSSPNYRVHPTPSSKISIFRDEAVLSSDSAPTASSSAPDSSGLTETVSSSPNFVRLAHSSSFDELDVVHETSSPIVVKLGSTSPQQLLGSSPTPSEKSLKRKREVAEDNRLSTRLKVRDSNSEIILPSDPPSSHPSWPSPTESMVLPSSPPQPRTTEPGPEPASSPIFSIPARRSHSDSLSSAGSAHASLQAALSSSPLPAIQYPVVRAPSAVGQSLTVPKRTRSSGFGSLPSRRLSPVPSEWEGSNPGARTSRLLEQLEEDSSPENDSVESIIPHNESQIRIVAEDEHHSHEATDELSALPLRRPSYRSPPPIPLRTNSLYGTAPTAYMTTPNSSSVRLGSLRMSMDSRLNSVRSYANSRSASLNSSAPRPMSAGSQVAAYMPTWARRYYSGLYRDSFQYLYSPNNSAAQIEVPMTRAPSLYQHVTYSLRSTNSITTATNKSKPSSSYSWRSFRSSLHKSVVEHIPKVLRPHLEARKSHNMAGIGPLVSNPTHPEAAWLRDSYTIQNIPAPQPPMVPSAHWSSGPGDQHAALAALQGKPLPAPNTDQGAPAQYARSSGEASSLYYDAYGAAVLPSSYRSPPSPHLHHDIRLNTGSSQSHGYGHPYHSNPYFHPPSVYTTSGRPAWFSLDLQSTQVACFILGFIFPITWFVAALSPLPRRPVRMQDIEKREWDVATHYGTRVLDRNEEIDIVTRLRIERHIKGVEEIRWQNARWWRRMNRWMCLVGSIVIVLVIVLAVVGVNKWR